MMSEILNRSFRLHKFKLLHYTHFGLLAHWTDYDLFILFLQVVAIVMDKFTDVDIFKEAVDVSARGVPVYVLLDEFHLKSFLTMAESQDVKIQQLRVSISFKASF